MSRGMEITFNRFHSQWNNDMQEHNKMPVMTNVPRLSSTSRHDLKVSQRETMTMRAMAPEIFGNSFIAWAKTFFPSKPHPERRTFSGRVPTRDFSLKAVPG